jgi:N-methylhydantoinase A
VVSRHDIGRGIRQGPLIVEEFDATIVIPPDAVASRDAIGSVVVELGSAA